MHTKNCQVCGTKSSRNSRRCRKHERTSTYTAVPGTRFSGFSLILSCLTVSFGCGIVYSRGNRTPVSENKQTSVYLIKRKMKKKICIRTRTKETRPGALRSTALPHGSALHLHITCKLLLCVRLGMSRDRCCGHRAAETPLHDCTAVRVPKYHSVRKVKVFIVIFVVALAAGVKSKPSSKERLFLRTANPKRAAAHRRPGPEQ